MGRYSHVTTGEQSEALAALPDLSPRENSNATGAKEGSGDSSVLAFCLAPKHAESCPPVLLGALTEAIEAALCDHENDRENAVIPAIPQHENSIRLAGIGPATYGLGNRCSQATNDYGVTSYDNSPFVLACCLALSEAIPTNAHATILVRALLGRLLNAIEADEAVVDVIAAWPSLPEPIRRAMLALIG